MCFVCIDKAKPVDKMIGRVQLGSCSLIMMNSRALVVSLSNCIQGVLSSQKVFVIISFQFVNATVVYHRH